MLSTPFTWLRLRYCCHVHFSNTAWVVRLVEFTPPLDCFGGPGIVRASESTRPSMDEFGFQPSSHKTVGAISILPLGVLLVWPERKSGPAAISVLCISKGLRLPWWPCPGA